MINILNYVECLSTGALYAFSFVNIILFIMIIIAKDTNTFCRSKIKIDRLEAFYRTLYLRDKLSALYREATFEDKDKNRKRKDFDAKIKEYDNYIHQILIEQMQEEYPVNENKGR